MKKHRSLKEVYYISFSLLIVVPILLVFFIALSIIRVMVSDSAVSSIQSAQHTVASSLSESVRDASLQLSHFVYVNNNELMRIAAMTDTADVSLRYHYATQLDELFQVAMAPEHTVVSGMIYMKDGTYTYLKQEVVIPKQEIMESGWYQTASGQKNVVAVGCYDPSRIKVTSTGMKRKEMVIAVALSPDIGTDRSDKIDVVVLFIQARIGSMMQEFSKKRELGTTVIIDADGKPLFGSDPDGTIAASLSSITAQGQGGVLNQGVYRMKLSGGQGEQPYPAAAYTGIVSDVSGTGWKVYTCIRTADLTGEFNQIAIMLLAVIAGLFALYIVFSVFFLRTIISPIHTMVAGLHRVEEGELRTHIQPEGHYEIRTMIHSFNRMVRQLDASIQASETAQQKKMEAEIKALQSQINPHFLVNTLNSIRFMAQVSKFDGIRRMAEALIRILTCSFRCNHSFYTVAEELEVLDSYLYLMKIRYSDGFEVTYEIQDSCRDCRIPRLILQPIVENSIVHGFVSMEEDIGRLSIRIREAEDRLYLEVEDNGVGLTDAEIESLLAADNQDEQDNASIGVRNVFSRLRLNFGDSCGLFMESEKGRYCKTVICLPVIRGGEDNHETGRDCR
ncbi:MAG: histidine kinase [Lachnospiraceae bacterium]